MHVGVRLTVNDLAGELTAALCQHLDVYRRHERSVAVGLGLRVSDLRCLREFRERAGFSVSELRRRLGCTQSLLSRSLSRLESAGLIVRSIDPHNHRCILANITSRGSELVQDLDGQLTRVYRQALERVPSGSAESALMALRQLLTWLPQPRDEQRSRRPAPAAGACERRSP